MSAYRRSVRNSSGRDPRTPIYKVRDICWGVFGAPKWPRGDHRQLRLGISILSTLLLFSACGGESSTTTWPDVPIEDAFGNEIITSSVLDGRPTIVNVWAAWCEPCKKELPQLQNFAAVHSELNVLTVNLGDDPDKVSEFLELNSIDLPVLMDRDGRFTSAIKVSGVPTTVFVSADGEVVARHKGVLDEEDLASLTAKNFS